MSFTKREIKLANKTFRWTGAIGPKAVVPRLVPSYAKITDKILDFGAGRIPNHAIMLRNKGYNVTAHEFGENFIEGVHDVDALKKKYDVIYASNVMNVQSSLRMAGRTLLQIHGALKKEGIFIVNFPPSPRYLKVDGKPISDENFETLLKTYFTAVQRVKNASTAVWICKP